MITLVSPTMIAELIGVEASVVQELVARKSDIDPYLMLDGVPYFTPATAEKIRAAVATL